MSVIISDDILQATRMTEEELRQEIAVLLFQKGKLTLAQASRMAGMSRLQFQHLLASRQVPVHYDLVEFEEDLDGGELTKLEFIDADAYTLEISKPKNATDKIGTGIFNFLSED